jgi:hypothetical protein
MGHGQRHTISAFNGSVGSYRYARVVDTRGALTSQILSFDNSTADRGLEALDAFKEKVDKMTWSDALSQSTKGNGKTGIHYEPFLGNLSHFFISGSDSP